MISELTEMRNDLHDHLLDKQEMQLYITVAHFYCMLLSVMSVGFLLLFIIFKYICISFFLVYVLLYEIEYLIIIY